MNADKVTSGAEETGEERRDASKNIIIANLQSDLTLSCLDCSSQRSLNKTQNKAL